VVAEVGLLAEGGLFAEEGLVVEKGLNAEPGGVQLEARGVVYLRIVVYSTSLRD